MQVKGMVGGDMIEKRSRSERNKSVLLMTENWNKVPLTPATEVLKAVLDSH